jgi:hypothetical protein
MSEGPIANYTYSPWKDRPGTKVGFSAVGPGWKTLLETLDGYMIRAVEHALRNADGTVREEYRDKECGLEANITVLQIKEKFGGLRVYWSSKGLGSQIRSETQGAALMIEELSYKICEKCGSFKEVETKAEKNKGWVLTLCGECRKESDKV